MLLGRKGNPRPKTPRVFYAKGFVECGECGAAITAEDKSQVICTGCKYKFSYKTSNVCPKCGLDMVKMTNPTKLHYVYYHCTKRKKGRCTQKGLTEDEVNQQISDYLSSIQLSPRYAAWAIKYLNEVNDQEAKDRIYTYESLQKAYKNVCKRIDNLTALKISPQNTDGSILTDEEYKQQKQKLLDEKRVLETKISGFGDRVEQWLEFTEKAFDFATHAHHWFNHGDVEAKKYILLGLGSNLTLKDLHLSIKLFKPFKYIKEINSLNLLENEMFEHTKKTSLSIKDSSSVDQKTSMLPG
jgi:hypothetical protein